MDVTSENFSEAAAQLEALLPTCAFYAIDEEMTGIMLSKETAPNMADVCEARYAKMKRVVREYSLMQVGICLFHEQPDGSLLSRPFNFYVFPGASNPNPNPSPNPKPSPALSLSLSLCLSPSLSLTLTRSSPAHRAGGAS